ncbi:hypothetical protein EMMF5_003688 [Cystobasidiomycetes sp. EMM_F5]
MTRKAYQIDVCQNFLEAFLDYEARAGFDAAQCRLWLDQKATEQKQREAMITDYWTLYRRQGCSMDSDSAVIERVTDQRSSEERNAMRQLEHKNLDESLRRATAELRLPLIESDILDVPAFKSFFNKLYNPLTDLDWQQKPASSLQDVRNVCQVRQKALDMIMFQNEPAEGWVQMRRATWLKSVLDDIASTADKDFMPNLAELMQLESFRDIVNDQGILPDKFRETNMEKLKNQVTEMSVRTRDICMSLCNSQKSTRRSESLQADSIFAIYNCTHALQHDCLGNQSVVDLTKGLAHTTSYVMERLSTFGDGEGQQTVTRDFSMLQYDRSAVDDAKFLVDLITSAGHPAPEAQVDVRPYRFNCGGKYTTWSQRKMTFIEAVG